MDLENLVPPDSVYWLIHRIAEGPESPPIHRVDDPDEADVYRDTSHLVIRMEVYVEEPLELAWH